MSMTHESIMQLVLALGALSLSKSKTSLSTAENYHAVALGHKQRSLQYLQQDLKSVVGPGSDHNLVAILLLSVLDVSINPLMKWWV